MPAHQLRQRRLWREGFFQCRVFPRVARPAAFFHPRLRTAQDPWESRRSLPTPPWPRPRLWRRWRWHSPLRGWPDSNPTRGVLYLINDTADSIRQFMANYGIHITSCWLMFMEPLAPPARPPPNVPSKPETRNCKMMSRARHAQNTFANRLNAVRTLHAVWYQRDKRNSFHMWQFRWKNYGDGNSRVPHPCQPWLHALNGQRQEPICFTFAKLIYGLRWKLLYELSHAGERQFTGS